MIGWHLWQTLYLIYKAGTYAGAAKALGVDATTIGRRMKTLEQQLGFTLFLRSDNKLIPTSECQALLGPIEAADDMLHQLAQSSRAETGNLWREVRITAPPFLINNALAPAIGELTQHNRIKVNLFGTSDKAIFSRREADIAIRIEDRPRELASKSPRIQYLKLGHLNYAVYARCGLRSPTSLPWAGLTEPPSMTSGSKVSRELANEDNFQFQTRQFDGLREFVLSGQARAMLPRVIGDRDDRLTALGETVLEQPLWMLFHRQDTDIRHMEATREWISNTLMDCGIL